MEEAAQEQKRRRAYEAIGRLDYFHRANKDSFLRWIETRSQKLGQDKNKKSDGNTRDVSALDTGIVDMDDSIFSDSDDSIFSETVEPSKKRQKSD